MKHIFTSFQKLRIDDEIILTIGNFDGIHKGHGDILSRIKKEAKNLNLKAAIRNTYDILNRPDESVKTNNISPLKVVK